MIKSSRNWTNNHPCFIQSVIQKEKRKKKQPMVAVTLTFNLLRVN